MQTIALILVFASVGPQEVETPLIPPDAPIEQVATGYGFTEGPVVADDGNVLFADLRQQLVLQYHPDTGKTDHYRQQSGNANGMMFNSQGRLVACEGGARRMSIERDGQYDNLADQYEGKRFNSPNDLAIDQVDGVYFTDPRYGRRDDLEMEVEAVYYIDSAGTVTRIIDDLKRPNGIILSPDGKTLYVADHADCALIAYDVTAPGKLANGREFSVMDRQQHDGPDGLTVDAAGRVYAAGNTGIWVWSSTGQSLGLIPTPENPTNCTFAHDGRTLYITARTSLYRIELNTDAKP